MMRVGVVIMIMAATLVLLVFAKGANTAMTGKRYDFSPDEIAAGQHCVQRFLHAPYAMKAALDKRLGEKVDDRISLRVDQIIPGPLKADGRRKLTVIYGINRVGENMQPQKKATGMLNNADCSFQLTVIQR